MIDMLNPQQALAIASKAIKKIGHMREDNVFVASSEAPQITGEELVCMAWTICYLSSLFQIHDNPQTKH